MIKPGPSAKLRTGDGLGESLHLSAVLTGPSPLGSAVRAEFWNEETSCAYTWADQGKWT